MADSIYYTANTLSEESKRFAENQIKGFNKQAHDNLVNKEVNQLVNIKHLQNLTHMGGAANDKTAESTLYLNAVAEKTKNTEVTTKEANTVKKAILAINHNANLDVPISTNVIQDNADLADYSGKVKVVEEKYHGTTRYYIMTQSESGETYRQEISDSNAEAVKKAIARHERVTIETGSGYLTTSETGEAYAYNVKETEPKQTEVKKKKTEVVKPEQRYSVNTKDDGIDEGVQNDTHQIAAGNTLDDKSAAMAYAYNLKKGETSILGKK